MPSGGHNKGKRSFGLTREQLIQEYLEKNVSMAEFAEKLGCSVKVIWQAMKDYDLPAKSKTRSIGHGRPLNNTKLRDHEWLVAQLKTRSLNSIGKELGIRGSTVGHYARSHNLVSTYITKGEAIKVGISKRDKPLSKAHQLTKESIIHEYINKDVNMYQACEALGCCASILIESMTFHKIPPKNKLRKIAIVGKHSGRWGGGRIKMSNGYVAIRSPEHPLADKAGNVMEHRLVVEAMLGRYLTKGENVHHINRVRDDNRYENLQVLTAVEHRRLHRLEDARAVQELENQDKEIQILKQKLHAYKELYGELP